VWRHAVEQGLTIVTKDADFHQRSFLFGHPPKVVWVRCGNASTLVIERLLRDRHIDLVRFSTNAEGALLIIE
jgi:predicted nuclease of predicted toxin-antitoxin system